MHESEVYQRDGGSSIFLLLFGSDAMFGRLLTWKLQEVGVNGRCCYLLVFFFGQDVVWVESLKNERFGMPWVQFCKARSPHEPMGFRLISPCDEKGFFLSKCDEKGLNIGIGLDPEQVVGAQLWNLQWIFLEECWPKKILEECY